MKILVFDDSPIHRESAKITLAGHDLTIVETYEEAEEAIARRIDVPKRNAIFANLLRGNGFEADCSPMMALRFGHDRITKYRALKNEADKVAVIDRDFDVVMTDLMVPGAPGHGPEHEGVEMPLGAIIALLALAVGIKHVALVTDLNHHNHPASAALDRFPGGRFNSSNITCVNNSVHVWCDKETGEIVTCDYLRSAEGREKYPGGNEYAEFDRKGLARGRDKGKDWGRVLMEVLKTL